MRVLWLITALCGCALLTNLDSLVGDASTSPAPECADGAALCDDFSEPIDASFFPPWTARHLYGNGELARTLVGSTPCLSSVASEGGSAFLEKDFTTTTTRIHYAFDLQIVRYPTINGAASVNGMQIPITPPVSSVRLFSVVLQVQSGATALVLAEHFVDGSASGGMSLPFTPPSEGDWTHIDVVVDVAMGLFSVAINGGPPTSMSTPLTVPAFAPTVFAGINFMGPALDQVDVCVTNTTVWLE